MGQLTRDCPHCHTKSVSMTAFSHALRPGTKIYITALYCNNCYGGYFAEVRADTTTTAHDLEGNIEVSPHLKIIKEYPAIEALSSPQHVPSNIDRFYLQAATSLVADNLDASSVMSRKVLEVAVKSLAPEATGNLYSRIESLATEGKITEELKNWAHIIRDGGNNATHEESPVTKKFAKELLSFAEMFLMYTFTMPGMMEARRNLEEQEENESNSSGDESA